MSFGPPKSPILALKTPFWPPKVVFLGQKSAISRPAQGFPGQGSHTKAATAVAVRMHRSQQCAAPLASKKPDICFAPMPSVCPYRARHHEGGYQAWRLVTTFVVYRPGRRWRNTNAPQLRHTLGTTVETGHKGSLGHWGRNKCRVFCLPAALRTAVSGAFAPPQQWQL